MRLVSVIIPVYNVEKYLNRCVDSVVKQTYSNLEIILVDDGSPDNCPDICDQWASKDSRIKVIHKKNGGLSDARNAGIKIATGDYIGFVDSDDWIAPEMYQKLVKAIQDDESDISMCSVKMVWEDTNEEAFLTVSKNTVLTKAEAQYELLEERLIKQPVWYKLYKREMAAKIPFETGKYHEDVFWSYQIIGECQSVSIIDYVGYYYWQRTGSIMGIGYSLKRLDAMEAYCLRDTYFSKEFPNMLELSRVNLWEQCIYHGQMALSYLNFEECTFAINKLKAIQNNYPIHSNAMKGMKLSHKIWISLSKLSLKYVCLIKNAIGVGK